MPPLLLISVRDAAEAKVALESGAEVIDVKDPNRGSLGRASNTTVTKIIDVVSQAESAPAITMALGELGEWNGAEASIPAGASIVKLGLAGCASRPHWQRDWAALQSSVREQCPESIGWVGVIYADSHLAKSPSAMDVIRAAAELDCRGVLIDTYCKSAGRLFDFVDVATLQTWTEAIRERGKFVALAGSLRADDLPRLTELNPDILAVRGGVCAGGERRSAIDARSIDRFRKAMEAVWPASSMNSLPRTRRQVERHASLPPARGGLAVARRGGE